MRTRAMQAIAAAIAVGCQARQPAANEAAQLIAPNLVQVVRLTPEHPAQNQEMVIESVIINRGTVPVDLISRVCGLDAKGDLELTGSLLMCAAYSMHGHLAPGDSVRGFDARVVASRPGRYTLRVRHLLEPERWVEIPVEVR